MRLLNKFGLPETIVRATQKRNDMYDRGAAHRSATQLIMPPRIDALRKRHYADMQRDVSEEWFALFGSAVHYILELGIEHNQIAEERLFATVDGWTISAALDCQTVRSDGTIEITDYKVTAVYSVMKDEDEAKREWVEQMNIQAFLVEENKNVQVSKIAIVAIVRDWQRRQAAMDPLYPQAPIVEIELPLWTQEQRREFIEGRIRMHRIAEMDAALGLPLPDCSSYDRWEQGHKYKVMKKGAKRASRSFDSREEAEAYMTMLKGDYDIVEEQGRSVRCEGDFCQVASWCDQFQRMRDEAAAK